MTNLIPTSNKTQSVLSKEPIYINVTAQVPGSSSPEDVSGDTVSFAFKAKNVAPDTPPGGADWTAGTMTKLTNAAGQTVYLASIIVGPGGAVTLTPGTYTIFVYLADALGDPVAQVGTLTITSF